MQCLSLLALITLAWVALLPASPALADGYSFQTGRGFGQPDSNGYVPEYIVQTVGTCTDGILATTHYEYNTSVWYGPNVMWIEYDSCEMDRLGATPAGWDRVKAHERAHSRGWQHGEGDPKYNDAFYPQVNVR
jgi:hypothetical protein